VKPFRLEVVTPERTVISEEVESLVVPADDGYLGVLAGHAPLLCLLRAGQVEVIKEGRGRRFAVAGGYLEVSGNRAILLADAMEEAREIDVERARQALGRATSLDARTRDRETAEAAAERARARLRVARGGDEGSRR
jgi:F-type H+-transporting ATPase subunit epsilon